MVKITLTDEQWETIRISLLHEARKQDLEDNAVFVEKIRDALNALRHWEEA